MEAKRKAFMPCVPTAIVELISETDSVDKTKAKVRRFMKAGCREGVIVDCHREQVWIFNDGDDEVLQPIGVIEFEHWPGFELDCEAILHASQSAYT